MHSLDARLTRLEARHMATGPLLISWLLDDDARATAEYQGTCFVQAERETREEFLSRVSNELPAKAVVWINQLDERL